MNITLQKFHKISLQVSVVMAVNS